jgi:hypothetical protein
MVDRFREVEETFVRLREKFNDRRISEREYVDSLKQLRIKDEEGRFWMIGARTGKWYTSDGGEWTEAKPPSQRDKKAICIACGFENDLEAEFCARCGNRSEEEASGRACPACGSWLGAGLSECPSCGAASATGEFAGVGMHAATPAEDLPAPLAGEIVIRSLHPLSFFWFFGVLGLFMGILFGLLAGVTSLFPRFVAGLPGFFVDIQGNLVGGVVYSVLGGITGFAVGGAVGIVGAAASNGVLSLVGGLRIRRS